MHACIGSGVEVLFWAHVASSRSVRDSGANEDVGKHSWLEVQVGSGQDCGSNLYFLHFECRRNATGAAVMKEQTL